MNNPWQTQPAVLVFPGQGSQWAGMAVDLLDTDTVFAARLRECAAAIEANVPWSVEQVLRQHPGAPSLDHVEVVQPVLFAVHVALAELWLSTGLIPRAVVGQSQGEIAAAAAAGALCLADAARIIVARSQLFADELVGVGGIASIGLRSADIERYLVAYGGKLEVAGLIGPRSVTGGYWYANARRPVLFEPTMRRLLADGCRLFVESSTHPVLTVAMAATADQAGCPATITATLRRGHGGPDQFLAARARIAAGPTPARTAA